MKKKLYVEEQQNFRVQQIAMLKCVQKVLLQFLLKNVHGERTARFYHQIFVI